MSKLQIIKFIFISIVSCTAMVLFLYATMNKPNTFKNGFTRKVTVPVLKPINVVDLKNESFYIIGNTEDNLYLGNLERPFTAYVFDKLLKDSQSIDLVFPHIKAHWKNARLLVDSPFIYSSEGMSPFFLKGDLNTRKLDLFIKKSSYFNLACNISPSAFVVRATKAKENTNMILKIQADSPFVIKKDQLLEKQVDGVFCTDGQFRFDKKTGKLIYTYYYRNQYLVLDTNLNLIYTGKTIDTNSVAKVSVANISKQQKSIFSAPATFVNATSCIENDHLYIRSTLLADNESGHNLNDHNVVDVYDLTSYKYIESFYIPKQNDEVIMDFRIFNNNLYALFRSHLVVYRLPTFVLKN